LKKIRRLLALLALFALAAGFVYWQNFTLQVEPVELFFESLPPQFDGLRVAELSDLHGRSFGKNNVRLLRTLQKARPDMICICGDLFDEKTDLTMLEPLLTGLTDIAPVYYVTGNHEWQVKNLREILQKMRAWGVTVLENEGRVLSRGGAEMVVAGVHDPCGPYDMKTPAALVRELRSAQGNDFILMLSHRNDELAMWSQLGVQLVLSGHCHGGVVRLPFVGGVFGTRRELFPEYDAGVYRQDGTTLFVSRGLGYTNVHFRLFNRPHVPIMILRSGKT
jgi:predicted MPP superfamily phosphohydrolase